MNNATQYGFKDETQKGGSLIVLPDVPKPFDEKLDVRSTKMLERANAFVCTTPDEYKAGDLAVSECASLVKRIKEIHDPICAATNTAHKTATGARKSLVDPINQASTIIDNKLTNFKMAYEKKLAAERKALEDKARKEQEDAAMEQAAEMEKEGQPKELVDAVLEMGTESLQVEKPRAPDLSSVNSRTPDWSIEVVDKNLVPEYYKTVNEGAILADVRSKQGNIKVPGVKIFDTFKTRRKAL